jgi:drug/metabolite transporter (DMT)-like permease
MKSVIFACLAVMLYAISNVIIEQKLSKFSTVSILLCSYPLFLLISLVWLNSQKLSGATTTWPTRDLLLFVLLNAAFWFLADALFIGAYTNGGSLMTITTIVVMFPIFASLLKFLMTRNPPSLWHIAGWILAAVAVILVTKGELTTQ